MYCDEYAPWDHYPKTLKHVELQNPTNMPRLFTDSVHDFFETLCCEKKELYNLLWNVHPMEKREKLIVDESQIKRLTDIATKLFVMADELIE